MLSLTKQLVMKSHIDHLARLNNVKLVPITSVEAAGSWMEQRVAWVPETTDLTSYFVALHEIGHFCIKGKLPMLEEEYQAWYWALGKARFKPDKYTWNMIAVSLRAYLLKAKRDQRIKLPEASHPFWSLLNEAKQKAYA